MLALVLAIGFSAFTKPHFDNERVFRFTGSTTSQSAVQLESNWLYIGNLEDVDLCDDLTADKACRIAVAESHTSGTLTANSTTLDQVSSIVVNANQTASPNWRVQTALDGSYNAIISNQIP